MPFSNELRNRVWQRYHGNSRTATDPFGDYIEFSDFDIDHILPVKKGGSNDIRNLIPMSEESNRKKGDALSGKINGSFFEVQEHLTGIGTLYVDGKQVSK